MSGGNVDWDKLAQFLLHFSPWILVKFLFWLGFATYFIFALVVLTQIFAMTKTIKSSLNVFIRIFGFLHLIFAGLLLLFMLGVL